MDATPFFYFFARQWFSPKKKYGHVRKKNKKQKISMRDGGGSCGFYKFALFVVAIVVAIRLLQQRFVEQHFLAPRNATESARLEELIRRGDLLVDTLEKEQYPDKKISKRIVKNWRSLRAKNRIGITPENTDTPGFVINKDDAMQLCLTKSPAAEGNLDELNMNTFVLIHEIAHLGALEYEHGGEFLAVFKKLLRKSIDIGIWTYVDYGKNPQMYCDYNVDAVPTIPEKFRAIFD
jgi:hypothetical protein